MMRLIGMDIARTEEGSCSKDAKQIGNVHKGFAMEIDVLDAITITNRTRVAGLRVAFGQLTDKRSGVAWTVSLSRMQARADLWPIPCGALTIVSGRTMLVSQSVSASQQPRI